MIFNNFFCVHTKTIPLLSSLTTLNTIFTPLSNKGFFPLKVLISQANKGDSVHKLGFKDRFWFS